MTSDRSDIKRRKELLRRIEEHLRSTYVQIWGCTETALGFVDLITHPRISSPCLNFATPRRKTAFVSNQYIEKALAELQARTRSPQFVFIDTLGEMLGTTILQTGLTLQEESSIWVIDRESYAQAKTDVLHGSVDKLDPANSLTLWQSLESDPLYVLHVSGFAPLVLSKTASSDREIDIIIHQDDQLLGYARYIIEGDIANILAVACPSDDDKLPQQVLQLISHHLMNDGCDLIFTASGCTPQSLPFENLGNMVAYGSIEQNRGNPIILQDHPDL